MPGPTWWACAARPGGRAERWPRRPRWCRAARPVQLAPATPATLSALRRRFRLFRNAASFSCSDAESSNMGRHRSAVAGAGVNGPAKAVLHQQRKIAAVIDVRVREHHRGNVLARKREVAVALGGFLSAALVLAAIQQIAFVADSQLMHGAGDYLGRAPEGQFHPFKNTLGMTRSQVNPRLVGDDTYC